MINETHIALGCPECENMNLYKLSIFSFSGARSKVFECDCGHTALTVTKNSNKSYKVNFICPICREEHSFVIPSNQFWSEEVYSFPCPFYEAISLFIGKEEALEKTVNDYINEELAPPEKNFLPDFPVIEKILAVVEDIEKNPDKYDFCTCDAKYSIAYNENALYVICDGCGMSQKIPYNLPL